MKIKEKVYPERMITMPNGHSKITSIGFSHYCPKCGICLDYKIQNIYDLKFCFNCGVKINTDGMRIMPEHLEKPIIVKNKDVFSYGGGIRIGEEILPTTICKDLTEYL